MSSARFELALQALKVLCFTRLSYEPIRVERRGSNPQHPDPQSGALPIELQSTCTRKDSNLQNLLSKSSMSSNCITCAHKQDGQDSNLRQLVLETRILPTELPSFEKTEAPGFEPGRPFDGTSRLAICRNNQLCHTSYSLLLLCLTHFHTKLVYLAKSFLSILKVLHLE